ncbi:ubiquitin domain-containing protein 7SL RNA2-like [Nymphaea colorata]|uniref:ubiquitin domain-containing protein 7SL RNA2-like n=1 Tax=Nymphaea colorata TaxID=210225 RepID=UPI00129ED829|nr:ubiquitin domain-containing protein 7SL RNA2-like [Nymphaea colorata]
MEVDFELSNGSKYRIEVGFFDTVLDIKERLEKCSGIPVKQQSVLFNNTFMDDEKDVQPYGLWEGCCVEVLVNPEAGKLQVHVKGLEDLIFLKFDKSNTVNFLKPKEGIHERIGVPANRLLLLHQNRKLSDPVLTLAEFGVSEQSRIDVLIKPAKTLSPKRHSTMNIIVEQARTNKEVYVEVKSTDTVSGLKEKLQALEIAADEHFFVHNQSPMSDKKTLEWHRVEEGHVLTIFQGSVTSPEPGYTELEEDI